MSGVIMDVTVDENGFTVEKIEQLIEQEIANKKTTRKSISVTYAIAIRQNLVNRGSVDFMRINNAILTRYSMSGLEWIKEAAHKIMRS